MAEKKKPDASLVSFGRYAEMRGVSAMAVTKAVAAGRISTITTPDGRRRIDPTLADAEWEANTQADKRYVPTKAEREAMGADEVDEKNVPKFAESRAIREAYAAQIARLEYEERSGLLIPAEKVKAEAFKLARTVRDAILNVPDRIANELASYDDPARIHERMTQELIQALEELVNSAKRGV